MMICYLLIALIWFFSIEPSFYPLNLTAYNSSSTSLTVIWGEVPDEHKNGIITEYTIKYKNNYESNFNYKQVDGSTNRTELTGLEKYELYDIYIRAATSYGYGNYSQQPVIAQTAEDSKWRWHVFILI